MTIYPRIPIFANDGSRCIGVIKNGIFKKRIKFSKHALHRPPALCFDVDSLKVAQAAGASQVEVEDVETGRIFSVSIALIWTKGFSVNRGFGEQVGLHLREFHIAGQPQQLGLFVGVAL